MHLSPHSTALISARRLHRQLPRRHHIIKSQSLLCWGPFATHFIDCRYCIQPSAVRIVHCYWHSGEQNSHSTERSQWPPARLSQHLHYYTLHWPLQTTELKRDSKLSDTFHVNVLSACVAREVPRANLRRSSSVSKSNKRATQLSHVVAALTPGCNYLPKCDG